MLDGILGVSCIGFNDLFRPHIRLIAGQQDPAQSPFARFFSPQAQQHGTVSPSALAGSYLVAEMSTRGEQLFLILPRISGRVKSSDRLFPKELRHEVACDE